MEGNGAQNPPNIPNNNLSTSGNINQQPVQIPPQMLEVWRRTQQGAPVIPYPVLTQALQLGPLQNDQYEALMQQTNALESYIPVIREHLRIRHLAYLGQMALQQQVRANPAASGASIHEVSPTTSPTQNMNNVQNSQQAQQFAARQNHVQQLANNGGPSNIHDHSNYQQGKPQQYVYLTSQGIPQQQGSSTSNGHIEQNTGVPRGWANAESSSGIPQPSMNPQSGTSRQVSFSVNSNIHQMRPQAANAGPAQTGRSAAQEAVEWERSLKAMPISWQSRPSVTQAPPSTQAPPRRHHPPTQTPVAQAIGSADQPRPRNSQSSAHLPTQGTAPGTSHPPNTSLMGGSAGAHMPPRPQPLFTPNSGPQQAPHMSSPTSQAPQNGPLATAPKPSTSTAAAAQSQYRFVPVHQAPSGAQTSTPHPSSAQAPQVGVPAQPHRQPAAPSSSTTGPNAQIPSSSPYIQNVQRKNLVHNFLAALGKRKAPAADIDDSSEGPNKRRAEEGPTDTRIQVGPSSSVSAPIVAAVPKVKPAPAPAPASMPASILAPMPASAPVPISAPIPAPAPKSATTISAPTPVSGRSGTSAQVNRQNTPSTRLDSSKAQEEQEGAIEGAMAAPVAVTVATEELTRQQTEELIEAMIAPPGSRPQTVSVPVRAPTAQAPPTPVAPAAPAPSIPVPSTSAPAPSEITPTPQPNSFTTTRGSPRSAMPIPRPVPASQRTVAPTPKKAKAPVEVRIKQEEDDDDEKKFRETFAVWDLRKRGKVLQTPKKTKEVINLVTPSSAASPLKGQEKARTVELESTPGLRPPSDLEPLFLPKSPEDITGPPSLPHMRLKYEDEDGDDGVEKSFVWGPPPGTNRVYVDVPIVKGRGYARHKGKSKNKGKERIREWELREEAEDEHHASLAGACQWSGEHDEHDDEILRVVKCRWRKCGAVLQSRTHCLKHVQVMHVGELEDAPDGWEKFCRWEGCAVDSFVTPNMLLDHVAWHIRGKWLCRFDKCLRIFDTSEKRKAHHFSRHLSWETYKPLVPRLKLSTGVSQRFASPPPLLPERWFTWDRGWFVDVVANPSASDVGRPYPNDPNVLASEGLNSSPLRLRLARDGRSHAGAGRSFQMEPTAARHEYRFLVPYYPPDFYCSDLRVGLDILERQLQEENGHENGGEERGRGSTPDELLLVGSVQAGLNRAEEG